MPSERATSSQHMVTIATLTKINYTQNSTEHTLEGHITERKKDSREKMRETSNE